MSGDIQPPPVSPTPGIEPPLLERIGLSGQLLGGGAVVGLIALFLPFISVSVNMQGALPGGLSMSNSASAIQGWQGKLCFVAYAAAIACVFMLYPLKNPQQRNLLWGGLAAGGLAALLALWLMIDASRVGGGAEVNGVSVVKTSIGIGGYLNLLAAAAVAYGGFLKAKEEKLL